MNKTTRHLALPADRFYWAVLDVRVLDLARWQLPRRDQLSNLFDATLPIPVEDVQAVYVRVDRDSAIACGMDRGVLADLIESNPEALVIAPAEIPGFVAHELGDGVYTPDPASFNVLIGDFEHARIRKLRRHANLQVAAALLLIALLLVIGFERRRSLYRSLAHSRREAQTFVLAQTLGLNEQALNSSAQPPAARFVGELRRLRQTRAADLLPQDQFSGDGVTEGIVADLFGHWPAHLHMQTEAITITESAITIVGQLPSAIDAQEFATAVGSFDPIRWSPRQPAMQSNSRDNSVRLTLRFEFAQAAVPKEENGP